ncbi:tigger transposable element-derived protein 2-like [Melanaphis sacchari]|uniref:tigger transposable element-derived protein 2-like n=1 Tax=Melanaphis sacchari TaxID=742174 RepID=UPI000DC13C4D|nr:tigger transposable element-derived protein 2-like [Melanaphis sacchari]
MSSKRKRVVLTIKEKIDIIAQSKSGETGRALAEKYGVGTSTISDIKKNADSILRYVDNLDNKEDTLTRKMMKKYKTEVLEDVEFTGFVQNNVFGFIVGPSYFEEKVNNVAD